MDNEIFKEIAKIYREVAECEDDEMLEEYQIKYIAKMLKINKLGNKL